MVDRQLKNLNRKLHLLDTIKWLQLAFVHKFSLSVEEEMEGSDSNVKIKLLSWHLPDVIALFRNFVTPIAIQLFNMELPLPVRLTFSVK